MNINQIATSTSKDRVHWLTDFIPFSKNKIDMVYHIYEAGDGADAKNVLEFFFPLIQFHSRWTELTWQDIHYTKIGNLKGAMTFNDFFEVKSDVSSNYMQVNKREPLTNYADGALRDILDYCDEKTPNILFVIVPQFTGKESRIAQYNMAQTYIEDRGYTVLNMIDHLEDIGLDLTEDYIDMTGMHTNLHGSLKITKYLSEYLVENYSFTQKTEGYEKWDKAYEIYSGLIEPYLTDDEKELLN